MLGDLTMLFYYVLYDMVIVVSGATDGSFVLSKRSCNNYTIFSHIIPDICPGLVYVQVLDTF